MKLLASKNNWWARSSQQEILQRLYNPSTAEKVAAAFESRETTMKSVSPIQKVQFLDATNAVAAMIYGPNLLGDDQTSIPAQIRAYSQRDEHLWDDILKRVPSWTRVHAGPAADGKEMIAFIENMFGMMAGEKLPDFGLVRLHLASALQRLPLEARWPIATALAQHEEDANDRQQPLMIWYGIEPAVAADPMKGVEFIASAKIPTVRRLVARRIAEDIEKNAAAVDALVALMTKEAAVRRDILAGMAAGLEGFSSAKKPQGWSDGVVEKWISESPSPQNSNTPPLQSSTTPSLQSHVRQLSLIFGSGRATDELIAIVKNAEGDANARRNAFTGLTRSAKPELLPIVRSLINDKVLGTAARSALAAYDDPNIPKALLNPWPGRSEEQQAATVATLVTRPSYAHALLDAVKSGQVPVAVITPYQARAIRSLNDADLSTKLTAVWGELRDTPEAKKAELADWTKKLTPERLSKGEAAKGKLIFGAVCASCHKLYGEGGMIGPDLTGGDRHKLSYLLENIVDPNAIVPADYRMSVFKLKDGRTLTGVIPAQTEKALTIQTPAEKLTLEKSQITEQQQLPMSLMPEGQLTALGEENVVHLMAYLQSLGPVR
jgi:putative heme-binding domain-containing protein